MNDLHTFYFHHNFLFVTIKISVEIHFNFTIITVRRCGIASRTDSKTKSSIY
jgi:hypothetical protein